MNRLSYTLALQTIRGGGDGNHPPPSRWLRLRLVRKLTPIPGINSGGLCYMGPLLLAEPREQEGTEEDNTQAHTRTDRRRDPPRGVLAV